MSLISTQQAIFPCVQYKPMHAEWIDKGSETSGYYIHTYIQDTIACPIKHNILSMRQIFIFMKYNDFFMVIPSAKLTDSVNIIIYLRELFISNKQNILLPMKVPILLYMCMPGSIWHYNRAAVIYTHIYHICMLYITCITYITTYVCCILHALHISHMYIVY